MKPPFAYYGAKIKLARRFVPLFPPHTVYVDVFGGSGAVLFAKEPARCEIYNDLDNDLVNLLQVLRDRGPELCRKLMLTPYARAEYASAKDGYEAVTDPVERARRTYVLIAQSYNGCKAAGWSRDNRRNRATVFHHAVKALSQATLRLRHVQIENQDFRQLVPRLDGPDVLLYVDPPYHPEVRTATQRYSHEMTAADHEELLAIITKVQGMVVLSGYSHPAYEAALIGWERHEFDVYNAAGRGIAGDLSPCRRRTEVVWMNPQAAEHGGSPQKLLTASTAA